MQFIIMDDKPKVLPISKTFSLQQCQGHRGSNPSTRDNAYQIMKFSQSIEINFTVNETTLGHYWTGVRT